MDWTYLRIPNLTTERTRAFMPAQSPPEVRMAIFIMMVDSRKCLKGTQDKKGFIFTM